MSKNIEIAVKFMEDIAKDDSHGYDQAHRNSPNYDCSSLVGTALNKGGFNVNPSSTTRNLYKQLINNGFVAIGINDSRKRGDIFLKVGHHVVMCTNSNSIVHASINEKGRTVGGRSGDQTGKEICVRSFYNYRGGWDYHLRYNGVVNTNSVDSGSGSGSVKSYLSLGDKGNDVKEMQTMLIACNYSCGESGADGDFGSDTKNALVKFQGDYGLEQDGKYGKLSKAKLTSVYNNRKVNAKHGGTIQVDGIWGVDTTKLAQKVFGTPIDGKISNQLNAYKSICKGIISAEWNNNKRGGSTLVKAMQRWLGITQDGYIGTSFIKNLQRKMGTPIDGKLDKPSTCIKAFQRWLNKQ